MRISDWSSDVCSSDLGFRWTSADAATPPFAPNAFIRIDRASNVTLVMPNQEMGQGIYTAHSQLLAEELDVSLGRVTLEAAPPDDELYGGPRKRQGTGGSSSLRAGFYPTLRRSEEHTSELQSLMRTSYAVFCLKKK